MTRPARCRRPLVLVTLVCFMAACHHWVPLESPVEQSLAERPGKARVTLRDGQVLVFDSAWVAQDTVFGLADSDTTSIPLSEVAGADVRKLDVGPTVALMVLGAAVVGVAIAFAADLSKLQAAGSLK